MMRIILLLACLALTACGGDDPAPQARIERPDGIWSSAAPGAMTHIRSGTRFPDQAGTYERTRITDFAADGSDVGVSYQAPAMTEGGRDPALTLYVTYHQTASVTGYLDQASQAIVDRFDGISLVQEGVFEPEGGSMPSGPIRLFRMELDGGFYRTGVWVARKGNWLLKARFTYSETENPMATALQALMEEAAKPSGEGTGVHIAIKNPEGVAPDMEHVTNALKAIGW